MKTTAPRVIRGLIVATMSVVALAACTGPMAERMADIELSDEPLTGKFVWHDLITDDSAAARGFYGGLFGWSFEVTTHPNGGDYTLIRHGERYLGGIVELADRFAGGRVVSCLEGGYSPTALGPSVAAHVRSLARL